MTSANQTEKPARKRPQGLGLENVNLSNMLNKPKGEQPSGRPIEVLLTLIDEDVDQPRKADNPGFSEASINELAESIKRRGVKSPISLRENPDKPGHYLINHGARRFRGTKRAGKSSIPAFIDNDYLAVDQVIENLQRNDLTPREIADWIGREQAKGKKNKEIAADLGKSQAYVSQHAVLLDLPDPIADVFNTGRVQDVTLVNELVKAHKQNPDEVENWLLTDAQEVTRGAVRELRDFLEEKQVKPAENGDQNIAAGAGSAQESAEPNGSEGAATKEKPQPDPDKLKKAIVQIQHDNRPGRLLLNKRPPAEGFAWIKYDDDGHEIEVSLQDVRLVSLVEA